MKIALSTSVMQRGKSGVGQYILALTRALLDYADAVNFSLLVLEDDIPLFDFAKHKMRIVPVAEKWRPAVKNILWHHTVLPRWIADHQMAVLHVPSYRRMLRRAPCKLVSTIHDLAPFHVRGKYDLARMLYGRVVVKSLAKRQDQIIAVSQNTARDVQRFFGVPLGQQKVILNGIDHTRFHPGNRESAQISVQNRWGLSKPFFLYVSRLEHPAKNHIRLIEAFNAFKKRSGSDWQLVLAGSDWHGAEHIHAAAKSSPYATDIRTLGFVEDGALPELYRAASCMTYPSLFEGFGLPPVEAMACGTPVISSISGSLNEVVGNAAQIVNPTDVSEIAEALQLIATHPERRTELVRAGLENARRFDWSENAAQVMAAYCS
ncbi:MAG: glycosyltransferase family 4 protein [Verrucomicrobiaceae bacterium]|nr:glycosyltransferase family 4 protein [Verrucomicrobiaceae bacterium]